MKRFAETLKTAINAGSRGRGGGALMEYSYREWANLLQIGRMKIGEGMGLNEQQCGECVRLFKERRQQIYLTALLETQEFVRAEELAARLAIPTSERKRIREKAFRIALKACRLRHAELMSNHFGMQKRSGASANRSSFVARSLKTSIGVGG